MKEEFVEWMLELQNKICATIEEIDVKEKFREDIWRRDGGGGGKTRVIQNGNVFEKGGVNTSQVYGKITDLLREQLKVNGEDFFACGLSLVLHPYSPMVPTVHANFRYFEVYDAEGKVIDSWFGGGADLTPYYLFDQDAVHFHHVFKLVCDKHDSDLYPKYKQSCDDYFVNHHRNGERRGVGGIFYDYVKPDEKRTASRIFEFTKDCGQAFIDAYFPIVERAKNLLYDHPQKRWQLIRRGRYVEFNLIHDRGTLFGLKSKGRTESILMSLPLHVSFEYDYQPAEDSEEARLVSVLMNPKDWV